jgi:hypothetical protein
MKVWGTTMSFHGYFIGEVEDVGRSTQTRNQIKIFTCDSDNESAEYLSSGIERGQLALQCVYDGTTAGTYYNLQTDFDADTLDTLLITYKNGSTKSISARVINLETAGGAADGGHMVFTVTFQLSGTLTYTPVAA